jgi:hypothetical protein
MNSRTLDRIEALLTALDADPEGETTWRPWAPRQAEISAEYDRIVGSAPQAQHRELLDAHFRRHGLTEDEVQAAWDRTDVGEYPYDIEWRPKGDKRGQMFYRVRAV